MRTVQQYYGARPTDVFGAYRTPTRRHRGVDRSHSTSPGTVEVPALHPGVVVGRLAPANWHGFGHQVTVRTRLGGMDFDISYAHGHHASPLGMGASVAAGQFVLLEGRSGSTNGSCMHMEQQRVGGGFIDPEPEVQRVLAGTSAAAPAASGIPFNEHDLWVQKQLNALGYKLVEDGRRGTATIAAVKDFQRKRKIKVDGIPGPDTTAHLKASVATPAVAPSGLNYLKGWAWDGIQRMLARHYGYTGRIDGLPGEGTWKAMQRFLARNYGYTGRIDGLPGAGTLAALARWLRTMWHYVGNDVPGPVMQAAFARANTQNRIAFS